MMSYYSHIIQGMSMFIHLGLNGLFCFLRLCFRFNRVMTFEYIYAWRRRNVSIQEALALIPQVRQSHQM